MDALQGILETALYAEDLGAAAAFYGGVLGLPEVGRLDGRHLFYRCGPGMLLIFDPRETEKPPAGPLPVPSHGARGPGHACFRVDGAALDAVAAALEAAGVPIEARVDWPQGGRSIYFRDPAGNSLECAEARIWPLV